MSKQQSPLDNNQLKIEVLRLKHEGFSLRQIGTRFGISHTSVARFVNKDSYKQWWEENPKPFAAGDLHDHHNNIERLESNRFIITSAQTNTFVHSKFLDSLEVAAEHLDAQLIVGTFTYNTTGFQTYQEARDEEWFDPRVVPYIIDRPVMLADDLMWCGELNILPTAVNPLSGLQSYTRDSSGIVPHAKVQLESLPTHKLDHTRMMYTTGTVTLRNYIAKKSGQKASFHHVFGALLVEVDEDGDWFVRQLISDSETGQFQDLDVVYTPSGVSMNNDVEAITWGDIHTEKVDPEVIRASLDSSNPQSMIEQLRPKYQFIHDVFDAYYRSHHHIKNAHKMFELYINQQESVEQEIRRVAEFLESIDRSDCQTIVVNSNHDRALDRWLNEADYRKDPVNALFFLELQLMRYKSIAEGENVVLLEQAVNRLVHLQNTRFLAVDESFKICDNIECGMHGDLGVSGSKGSAKGLSRLDARSNIGHSHTAKIVDGVYQSGHCMDIEKVDYAKGPSTWSHSHIVTYPNGKRTIITLRNGKWHG